MADQPVVQVSRLLDERGLSSFQIKLLAWSFFMVLIDGYDITAIAFAAPSLVKEWGLKPGSLGPVFSASLVGILFGSALFGWVGDRYAARRRWSGRTWCSACSLWPPLTQRISRRCSGCDCWRASALAA